MGGLLTSLASILLGLAIKDNSECGAICNFTIAIAYLGGVIFLIGFMWLMMLFLENKEL